MSNTAATTNHRISFRSKYSHDACLVADVQVTTQVEVLANVLKLLPEAVTAIGKEIGDPRPRKITTMEFLMYDTDKTTVVLNADLIKTSEEK